MGTHKWCRHLNSSMTTHRNSGDCFGAHNSRTAWLGWGGAAAWEMSYQHSWDHCLSSMEQEGNGSCSVSDYLDGNMQAWGPTPSQKPQNTYFCSLEFKRIVPSSITAGFGKKSVFLINIFLQWKATSDLKCFWDYQNRKKLLSHISHEIYLPNVDLFPHRHLHIDTVIHS